MRTEPLTSIPTIDHLVEATDAIDAALRARREWKSAMAEAEAKRVAFVAAQQRATQLTREASEIEGAAA